MHAIIAVGGNVGATEKVTTLAQIPRQLRNAQKGCVALILMNNHSKNVVTVKSFLRSITPPILWQMGHHLKHRTSILNSKRNDLRVVSWEGPFSSWKEAELRAGDGWNSPAITQKTLESALQIRDGHTGFEQDGVVRSRIVYSKTILAFLLLAFSNQETQLNLIDFGGGFGTHYYQNRKLLKGTSKNLRRSLTAYEICNRIGSVQHS
ncbi:hypothetical protein [Synechococcus sp. WH 5701]|uniref:hypothetical protein n=1 Tax=Synechococcus sp. WH 5701 TaxID=69042 RepID=UPI0012E9F179|nr:hypothetical protein [Synechococcus sp. WH 5701]